jgi:hypothetical protein
VIPWIKITVISTLVSSIVAAGSFYLIGKKAGSNEANADCRLALYSQQKAINEANSKAVATLLGQRESYRIALEDRASRYEVTNKSYQDLLNLHNIARRKSSNDCAKETIPEEFK